MSSSAQAAVTKYHRLRSLLKSRNVVLTVLEAESPRSECPHGWLRASESEVRAPPSGPNHLPKAQPPHTITLRTRISTYESGVGGRRTHTFTPKQGWMKKVY